MTNFIVNSLEDTVVVDDKVTLREAIEAANTNTPVGDAPAGMPGLDTIDFDELLSGGTITLTNGELQITDDLTINGLGADELTVSGNNASRVFNVDDGTSDEIVVVIDGLTIADGNTDEGSGIRTLENLTLNKSRITDNTAFNGGGIFVVEGELELINSIASNNTATNRGGGLSNGTSDDIPDGGNVIVTNTKIIDNNASVGGGFYNNFASSFLLLNSTVDGNIASISGGIDNDGNLNITNSTISNNRAGSRGGIFSFGEIVAINSTISGNTASFVGGIESGTPSGRLTLIQSTVSDNVAENSGPGGIFISDGLAELSNTIVAGNSGSNSDVEGDFTSEGYNLIGDGTGSTGFTAPGDQVGTSDNPIDPKLGPLQDNGGPTETQALLPDSPAIDAGDPNFTPPPDFDQRGPGFPRVLDGDGIDGPRIDIGAYETDFQLFDTLTVDTLVDEDDGDLSSGDVSLREAIGFISPEGTIDFDPSLASADVGFGLGTIGLTLGELVIDKSLTINGLGADELSVSGNNASRVFNVNDGDSVNQIEVVIEGLTITGGNAAGEDFSQQSGGGIFNRESLELSNSTISGNSSEDEGGGIANYDGSTLKVIDSTISDNSAGGDGGGITNRGTLIVKNSTISGNTSNDQGGGIYSQSTVEVKNSTISGNTASESGGGIHNSGDGTVEVIDSTILDNTALIDGGGIYNTDDGLIGLTGTIVQGNIAIDDGGGIANFDNGFITVDSSTIEGNEAIRDDGGGIYNIGNGTVEVIRSLIIDNIADTTSGTGGGILNRGTARVIDNSIIRGNSASDGGGIFNENFLELTDSFTIGNIPNDVISV